MNFANAALVFRECVFKNKVEFGNKYIFHRFLTNQVGCLLVYSIFWVTSANLRIFKTTICTMVQKICKLVRIFLYYFCEYIILLRLFLRLIIFLDLHEKL